MEHTENIVPSVNSTGIQGRQANFELLRIISMIMIVVLHINSYGGLLVIVNPLVFSRNYIIIWLTESLSIVAVNVYVLISGYFLVDSVFNLKKIIRLWGQVFFYSTIIYLVLVLVKQETFSIVTFSQLIMPVNFYQYWFVTIYLILFILSPLLNLAIHSLSKSQFKIYLGTFLLIFSVLSVKNPLFVAGGYSLLWFVYVYFAGAYMKLHYKPKYKWSKFLAGYIVFSLISLILVIIIAVIRRDSPLQLNKLSYFPNFNTLFVFLASICLFLTAVNFMITNKWLVKVILWFSPLTFGVYLIHMHPQLFLLIWDEILQPKKYIDSPFVLLIYPAMVLGIYISCSFIEFARKKLFYRLEYGAWMGNTYQLIASLYGRSKIKEFIDRW